MRLGSLLQFLQTPSSVERDRYETSEGHSRPNDKETTDQTHKDEPTEGPRKAAQAPLPMTNYKKESTA